MKTVSIKGWFIKTTETDNIHYPYNIDIWMVVDNEELEVDEDILLYEMCNNYLCKVLEKDSKNRIKVKVIKDESFSDFRR